MTQTSEVAGTEENDLTAAPAQPAYSGFLSRPEGFRDERHVRREDFPGADCRFAWKAATPGRSRLAPTRRIVGLIAHNLARVAERDT